MLKDHPYRKLAHGLRAVIPADSPQVLGLSASLTYAVGEAAVQRTLNIVCTPDSKVKIASI